LYPKDSVPNLLVSSVFLERFDRDINVRRRRPVRRFEWRAKLGHVLVIQARLFYRFLYFSWGAKLHDVVIDGEAKIALMFMVPIGRFFQVHWAASAGSTIEALPHWPHPTMIPHYLLPFQRLAQEGVSKAHD
jgi:hypothetical protein